MTRNSCVALPNKTIGIVVMLVSLAEVIDERTQLTIHCHYRYRLCRRRRRSLTESLIIAFVLDAEFSTTTSSPSDNRPTLDSSSYTGWWYIMPSCWLVFAHCFLLLHTSKYYTQQLNNSFLTGAVYRSACGDRCLGDMLCEATCERVLMPSLDCLSLWMSVWMTSFTQHTLVVCAYVSYICDGSFLFKYPVI